MDFGTIMNSLNYWAILTAALSSFVIGGLWYSPVLFGKAWMTANGFTEEELKTKGGMGKIFGGAFFLTLIGAVNLAMFLAGDQTTLVFGIIAGALAGIGWVATAIGTHYLFERKPLKLFFINAGYSIVTLIVMGAILGGWR